LIIGEQADQHLSDKDRHSAKIKAGLHAKGKTKKKQKADAPGQMKLF